MIYLLVLKFSKDILKNQNSFITLICKMHVLLLCASYLCALNIKIYTQIFENLVKRTIWITHVPILFAIQ